MNLTAKAEQELSNFIDLGRIMDQGDRRLLVTILFQHLYYPSNQAKKIFQETTIYSRYPNWASIFSAIFDDKKLKKLTLNNFDFAIGVIKEITSWSKRIFCDFLTEKGLLEEVNDLQELSSANFRDVKKQEQVLDRLGELKKEYPELEKDWVFYQSRWQELQKNRENNGEKEEGHRSLEHHSTILIQNIVQDWKQIHTQKREHLEQTYLQGAFNQYFPSLKQKIDQLDHLGDLFLPYYNFLGIAWNESFGKWNTIPWDQLEEYARTLQEDPTLLEIVQWLGRYQQEKSLMEEEFMSEPVAKEYWNPKPYGKSEINGVHHSDHLSTLIPSEVGLLSNKETEIIFAKKFVEKKLLTFQYRSEELSGEKGEPEIQLRKGKTDDYGPIILCIDTSGSMFGKPERIAKALALAILEIALKQKRKAYVISFSTQIKTLELSNIPKDFTKLVSFLSLSFHGGTDLQPALREAVKMLKKKYFSYADVLVISDFAISHLDTSLKDEIENCRNDKGTNFYSLQVARKNYIQNITLTLFDQHWVYDLDDNRIIRKSIEFLTETTKKKTIQNIAR